MTDKEIADKVYIEPIDDLNLSHVFFVKSVLMHLLPTLGGQTGLEHGNGIVKSWHS